MTSKLPASQNFTENVTKRLKSFIDKLTDRAVYKTEHYNFKSNIYENMLKAKNSKLTSKTGLKEHGRVSCFWKVNAFKSVFFQAR